MTDPVTLATASVATAVSFAIGWLSWPRAPALDGERFFKLVLATLLRGRVEAEGGDVDAWLRAVLASVPYHPAGRFPEVKITGDGLNSLPASIEGEAALIEKLASLPDVPSRWRFMYDEDEVGLATRLDDPAELGPDYDPARRLGTRATWDAVADWGATGAGPIPDALLRRVEATWVLVEGRSEEPVLDALEALVPRSRRVAWEELDTGSLEAVAGEIMEQASSRLVLVGAEAGIQTILRLMVERAPLRDCTLAVVSIGGVLVGEPGEGPLGAALDGWMVEHFTHHNLDTEVTRTTPYFCLQWLDRDAETPSGRGRPVGSGRFRSPPSESMTQEYVEVVDLGLLYEGTEPELVARGLLATVGCWVAG